MPQHLDNYQANKAIKKYTQRALDSSNKHNVPFLSVSGRENEIFTNLDTSEIKLIIEKLTIFESQ